eukprot:TRINITY_DN52524_c0_g1_i1.p3 TRINITY_DN52524_c0_g1~~TRINITY_DN52524_c0_g1_i1.p3  ORF type:complete len:115 (-),score=4.03 TRINITY_DN52524_c0_g1_i1:216-560(-)
MRIVFHTMQLKFTIAQQKLHMRNVFCSKNVQVHENKRKNQKRRKCAVNVLSWNIGFIFHEQNMIFTELSTKSVDNSVGRNLVDRYVPFWRKLACYLWRNMRQKVKNHGPALYSK